MSESQDPTKGSAGCAKLHTQEKIWSVAFLLLICVSSILALASAARMKTQYSIDQFLPQNHPLLRADFDIRKKFQLDRSQPLLAVISIENGSWLQEERLRSLTGATKTLREIEGVKSALGLGTVELATQSGNELKVGTLDVVVPFEKRVARASEDRMITPFLLSANGRDTLIVLGTPESLSDQEVIRISKTVRAQLESAFPSAKIMIGGIPAIQSQLTTLLKSELVRFMLLAMITSCFTLLLVFPSPWTSAAPFVTIVVANAFVLALMVWLGHPMTVLAVTIPILVAVNVLSLTTHTMLRLSEEATRRPASGHSKLSAKAELVFRTLRKLLLPNLLTASTTGIGFATLIISDVPVIRDFGLSVSLAMILSWLATTLVLIPLLLLFPIPISRTWVLTNAGWVNIAFNYAKIVVIAVAVTSSLLALKGQRLHWSARLFDDLSAKQEARIVSERIDAAFGGMIPLELIVEYKGNAQAWNDPQRLEKIDRLLNLYRAKSEVGSALGITDLIRQALGDPLAPLPQTSRGVAEQLFLISMSEASFLRNFIAADGTSTRIALKLRDVPSDKMQAALAEIEREAKSLFPDADIKSGGLATTVHKLNDELSRSLMIGFWHALGAIAFLLLIVFRSLRWTLIAAIPNLAPAAILLGVLSLTSTPIKPGVALVFSIALGFAFDNTVYILLRFKALLQESSSRVQDKIVETLKLEGNPCLVSSLCLLSGFLVFLFSEFEITQTFGIYMIVALFFGLIGDLIFLPALIYWLPHSLGLRSPPQNIVPLHPEPRERTIVRPDKDQSLMSGEKVLKTLP
ncbi:MAG: RND family transporter [Bdellovibrionales bacterium]